MLLINCIFCKYKLFLLYTKKKIVKKEEVNKIQYLTKLNKMFYIHIINRNKMFIIKLYKTEKNK